MHQINPHWISFTGLDEQMIELGQNRSCLSSNFCSNRLPTVSPGSWTSDVPSTVSFYECLKLILVDAGKSVDDWTFVLLVINSQSLSLASVSIVWSHGFLLYRSILG